MPRHGLRGGVVVGVEPEVLVHPRALTTVAATSRFIARHRRTALRPNEFTVLAVNWNTAEFLVDQLRALERFSPGVAVVIVDNASTDDSRRFLREAPIRA